MRPAAALALACGLVACSRAPDISKPPQTYAGQLARTLAIVRSATPADPKVLRILFYGQSITSERWVDPAVDHLRRSYPNVRFDVRNLHIGGFASTYLERTAARDVDEVQPDLIVFHVYGDHRAYERIIRTFRSRTAAEIVVQTDHPTLWPQPVCATGVRLSLRLPPGCKGRVWLKQAEWSDQMAARILPRFAARYGLAIEPQRQVWAAWLRRHHLEPDALIADNPHPNARGWALMAAIFDRWFDLVVATTPPAPQHLVADLPAPAAGTSRGYAVVGNRIELVAAGPLSGRVRASVDGQAPRDIDGCWQLSRVSRLPNVTDWPALRQVTVAPGPHRPERWTATISGLSPDQRRFGFALTSSVSGPEGKGDGATDFTSPDGRVRIAAADWMVGNALALGQGRVPEGYQASWDRHFACGDQPPVALTGGRVEQRFVVATGLPNGPHRLTLSVAPGAPAIRSIRVYRPPLPAA